MLLNYLILILFILLIGQLKYFREYQINNPISLGEFNLASTSIVTTFIITDLNNYVNIFWILLAIPLVFISIYLINRFWMKLVYN
jgi:hypothetical protein